ncbi:MAG: PAS domain S-box protein, partial [Bacteroidetes bacterium]|nr:PAS domain S-box protein [Bacteroidota bacterium]
GLRMPGQAWNALSFLLYLILLTAVVYAVLRRQVGVEPPVHAGRKSDAAQTIRFHSLTHSTPDVLWVVDAELYHFLYVSPSVEHLRGFAAEEVLRHNFPATLSAESREYFMKAMPERLNAFRAGSVQTYVDDLAMTCRGGETVWTRTWTRLLLNDATKKLELCGVTRDRTAQRLEDAIQMENEARLDLIHRCAHLGYIDINSSTLDVYWSDETFRLLGYAPQAFKPTHRNFFERVHPDDVHTVQEEISALLMENQISVSEYRIVRPDGEIRWMYGRSDLVRDDEGKPLRYIVVLFDITARKRAEEALHVNELRFRGMTEQLADMLFVTDAQGIITYVSPACKRLFGRSPEQVVGSAFTGFLPEYERSRTLELFRATANRRNPAQQMDLVFRHANGSHFAGELSTSILSKDGVVNGTIGLVRDVTERKRRDQELKASLREKEVLLKEIHHRVKNNLQIISSLISLQASRVKDEESRVLFDESRSRIRALALVHERLYWSESLASIDFKEYLKGVIQDLLHAGGNEHITIDLDADSVSLDIDQAIPCGLIVNELCTNALKHAFPDKTRGRIAVSLRECDDGSVLLAVRDDGIGLPADLDVFRETSMGMTLVTSLVDQIGGSLAVDRNGGTAFALTFRPQERTEPASSVTAV